MSQSENIATTPTPARPNQRRSRRQSPKGSTRVRAFRNALGVGPNIGTSVLDVSETGVRLTLKENLAPGTEFEVNLETVGGSRSVKAIAVIVWSVPAADGRFVVGASFQKAISYSDLQSLARS